MMYPKPLAYAVKHKDEHVRKNSRSGGIFTALSDAILEQGGAVYGCILSEDFRAVHVRAVDKQQRNAMRGSKYLQSELGLMFRQVREDLTAGLPVLFSGTSCQIAGLKSYLGKDYPQLICVDLVCHGVPSQLVWQKYLQWQENRIGSKIKSIDFRNKQDFGWKSHVESLFMEDGKQVDSKVFATIFGTGVSMRPSCYHCPYKDVMHPGDITIADFWGIDQAVPGFNDNKGVSLVLVNNEAGANLLDKVRDRLLIHETRLEDSMQPRLRSPFPMPANRDKFWQDFHRLDFDSIAKKYGGTGIYARIRSFLRSIKRGIKAKISQ